MGVMSSDRCGGLSRLREPHKQEGRVDELGASLSEAPCSAIHGCRNVRTFLTLLTSALELSFLLFYCSSGGAHAPHAILSGVMDGLIQPKTGFWHAFTAIGVDGVSAREKRAVSGGTGTVRATPCSADVARWIYTDV